VHAVAVPNLVNTLRIVKELLLCVNRQSVWYPQAAEPKNSFKHFPILRISPTTMQKVKAFLQR